MCGRFTRSSNRDVIAGEFGVPEFVNVDLHPRYNIAPSQNVEAIIRDGEEKRLGPMRWGCTATSTSETAPTPINARAETIATSRCSEMRFVTVSETVTRRSRKSRCSVRDFAR